MEKDKTGIWGEIYTARYLRDKKYEIYTANYSVRGGEIDLIARDGKSLCFVEVKTRKKETLHRPLEAVDFNKRQNIIFTSKVYMKALKEDLQPRFDVCEVLLEDDYSLFSINYIENAFEDDENAVF